MSGCDPRIPLEELLDQLGFTGRQIVEDGVNLLFPRHRETAFF
jgi:hypothetical protein